MDFTAELAQLRASGAPPEAFESLQSTVEHAIEDVERAYEQQQQELQELQGQIGKLEAHEAGAVNADATMRGLLELLDPEMFGQWLTALTTDTQALTAPELLLQHLARLRDFINEFSGGTRLIKDLLALPLGDAAYREELERFLPLELKIRELFSERPPTS